ncbi:MAG TPA: hypothetical protein VKY65_06770 [Alphaproteobacteria bacterium]|nr:hypothetical protein [Alphaproteobacteria bacterium]
MRHLVATTLAAFLCGVTMGQAAEHWQTLEVPEAGFSVSLPDAPKVSEPKSLIGETSRNYIVEMGESAYLVSYTIYPPERVRSLDARALLDAVRDAAVQDVGGRLTSERRFNLGAAEARELVIAGGDGLVYKARLYVQGERIYRTIVDGPPGFDGSAAATRFLDSFRIEPP